MSSISRQRMESDEVDQKGAVRNRKSFLMGTLEMILVRGNFSTSFSSVCPQSDREPGSAVTPGPYPK